jgi:hypothetical protein
LEVASGTGQHVMHFAEALSDLTWQPSDPDAELRESIALRIQEERRANVNIAMSLFVGSWTYSRSRRTAQLERWVS